MARRGRPPKKAELVDGLEGSTSARRRLKVILRTITEELSVPDACAELGVSEARFHQLRREVLGCALKGLEPRKSGRPRKESAEESSRVVALRQRIRNLELDLQAAYVREEIAVAMPHLLLKNQKKEKKVKKKRK